MLGVGPVHHFPVLLATPPASRASLPLLVASSADAAAAASSIIEGGLSIIESGLSLAVTALGLVTVALGASFAAWLSWQQYILSLRRRRRTTDSGGGKAKIPPGSAGYIAPREQWTLADLAAFDGCSSEDGPILLAADGLVFNVAASRNFYGPGGEYHVMAGGDASRLLARNSIESETAAQAAVPLNLAERAALSAWVFALKSRYDVLGRLADGADEAALTAAANKREAYYDSLAAMSDELEVRARLEAAWDAKPTAREDGEVDAE